MGSKPKVKGYASMVAGRDLTLNAHSQNVCPRATSNPDYDPSARICRFWLNGRCAYSAECKMAHRFETAQCPHCEVEVGASPLLQQQHLAQCTEKEQALSERAESERIECGICRERPLSKGRKFGLL